MLISPNEKNQENEFLVFLWDSHIIISGVADCVGYNENNSTKNRPKIEGMGIRG